MLIAACRIGGKANEDSPGAASRFAMRPIAREPLFFSETLHLRRHLMRTTVFICLALLLSAGCSRIPEPVGYDYSVQQKMQAVQHWDVLAADVANRINTELIINDYMQTPVYVKTTCGDEDTPCDPQRTSTFNEVFRDLLITELVRFGVPVRQQYDEDAITVHYKVQIVYHGSRRIRTIRPGLMTSIATGVMVFRNAPYELQTIAAVGLVDYLNSAAVQSSAHEVIITTSMIARDRYLFRASDMYYINDRDFLQYQETTPQTAKIPLISVAGSGNTAKRPGIPDDKAATGTITPEDADSSTDM